MRKEERAARAQRSHRNRHNGTTNVFKKNIIDGGQMVKKQGRLYFSKLLKYRTFRSVDGTPIPVPSVTTVRVV